MGSVSSLQKPLFQQTIFPKSHAPLYGPFERIFRVAFFQFAVRNAGWIEQLLIGFYRGCETKKYCCVHPFDEKRMDATLASFRILGGVDYFVDSPGARIHMMVFKAEDLEKKIQSYGASWVREGSQYIIKEPAIQSVSWRSFKSQLLQKTGWKVTDKGIITCENADLIGKEKKCFLHIYYPLVRLGSGKASSRLGYYLGIKQDCCFYDPRGTRNSIGTPSEKGFYLDANAVLEKLKQLNYKCPDIWVSGSCKTAPIAAFLKREYHAEGINCAMEQGWPNLQSMIDKQSWIPRQFALWNLSALSCRDAPTKQVLGVEEDQFNTVKKWTNLKPSAGKVVIIYTKGDTTVPQGAHLHLFALARQVSKAPHLLDFTTSKGVDGHLVSCLSDPTFVRRFTQIVWQ